MMLPMVEFVASTAAGRVTASGLVPDDAASVVDAVRRLCATVGAIITYGYDQAVVSALYSVAGMPEGEVQAQLDKSRVELGLVR